MGQDGQCWHGARAGLGALPGLCPAVLSTQHLSAPITGISQAPMSTPLPKTDITLRGTHGFIMTICLVGVNCFGMVWSVPPLCLCYLCPGATPWI